MNTNRLLIGAVAGGVAAFLAGWLIYGMLLMNFMDTNKGSATGVNKAAPDFLPLFLGNLCMALLLAYIFERWAGISTLTAGAKAGAILGAIMAAGYDLQILGTTNIYTPTAAIVDIIAATVMFAIVGGVVGLVMGRVGVKA